MLKMVNSKIQYPSWEVKYDYWHIHFAEMHLVYYWPSCDSSLEVRGVYASRLKKKAMKGHFISFKELLKILITRGPTYLLP